MTIFLGDGTVIQCSPYKYRLNLRIIDATQEAYGAFTPETKYLAINTESDLAVYEIRRI